MKVIFAAFASFTLAQGAADGLVAYDYGNSNYNYDTYGYGGNSTGIDERRKRGNKKKKYTTEPPTEPPTDPPTTYAAVYTTTSTTTTTTTSTTTTTTTTTTKYTTTSTTTTTTTAAAIYTTTDTGPPNPYGNPTTQNAPTTSAVDPYTDPSSQYGSNGNGGNSGNNGGENYGTGYGDGDDEDPPAGNLTCWKCQATSIEECQDTGEEIHCLENEESCELEVRQRLDDVTGEYFIESIMTGCKQKLACQNNQANNFIGKNGNFKKDADNTQCRPEMDRGYYNSVCRQCCWTDNCVNADGSFWDPQTRWQWGQDNGRYGV